MSTPNLNIRKLIRSPLPHCFLLLAVTQTAAAAIFTNGPSVRISANTQVEFKWATDIAWLGKIEVFTNPDGTGPPVVTKPAEDTGRQPIIATPQTVNVPVGGALQANTLYYVLVTASDPNQIQPDIVPQPPLPLPQFFTGAQMLSNVHAESITTDSATIVWSGNVIGLGKVVYGPSSLAVEDAFNITDHAIQLTGLSSGTTYQFTASNVHAIDGDDLASQSGQFTTAGVIPAYAAQVQQPINTDGTSVFSVRRGVIPVKFTLTLDGAPTCDLPAATIAVTRTAGGVIGPIDESVYAGPADTGSNFRIDSCQYVYNLSASALGTGTYRVDILINAQVVGSATFGLR